MSNHFQYPFNPIEWPAVPHDFTGDNNLGIYTSETTQRYVYGTRYLTWDGRVYKYMGVTTNGCTSYVGCSNTLAAETGWIAGVKTPAGSRIMVVTDTDSVPEDQMAGGMVQIYDTTIANSVSMAIVGNDASNGSNVRVYLEFPLPAEVTTSDSIEMFENPYRAIEGSAVLSADFSAWLGVPCVTAVTGYNVWTQTWGPTIISTGNITCDDPVGGERQVFFSAQGTMKEVADGTITGSHNQSMGYILNQGTGIAGPQVYLMCST